MNDRNLDRGIVMNLKGSGHWEDGGGRGIVGGGLGENVNEMIWDSVGLYGVVDLWMVVICRLLVGDEWGYRGVVMGNKGEGNLKVATRSSVKPKVLAPDMYAIDVKPIPHPLKNNRSAHLNYISHLKESVETVREIVEEARVVKPLDNALNYACQYTKLSQELLEYVIGTYPKSFSERDNKAPSTPVTRKKQVTFSDKPGTHLATHRNTTKFAPKGNCLITFGSRPSRDIWKATAKLFANVGYQWRPIGKKFTSGKLNCGYQWRPTGKKFALGELCPLTRLPVTCGTDHPLVSGLRLFKTRFRGRNGSCTHQFRTRAYDDVWTKQFKPRSSSNDVWTKQLKPRSSSNDVCSNQFRPRSSMS
ncbi:hypothetical protein Tco_1393492 [Tanacetum coccineum]